MDNAQFYQQMARKRLVRRPAPKAPPVVYAGQPAAPTVMPAAPATPAPGLPAPPVDPNILKRRRAGSIATSFPEIA